jgi:hypothetical protein
VDCPASWAHAHGSTFFWLLGSAPTAPIPTLHDSSASVASGSNQSYWPHRSRFGVTCNGRVAHPCLPDLKLARSFCGDSAPTTRKAIQKYAEGMVRLASVWLRPAAGPLQKDKCNSHVAIYYRSVENTHPLPPCFRPYAVCRRKSPRSVDPTPRRKVLDQTKCASRSYHTKCTMKCGLRTRCNEVSTELGPMNPNRLAPKPKRARFARSRSGYINMPICQ